jgi:hypothetical protein
MKRTITLLLAIAGSFILSSCISLDSRGRARGVQTTTDQVTLSVPRSATIETPTIRIR